MPTVCDLHVCYSCCVNACIAGLICFCCYSISCCLPCVHVNACRITGKHTCMHVAPPMGYSFNMYIHVHGRSLQTDKYKLTATPETESFAGLPLSVTFPLTSGGATSDSGEGMHSDERSLEPLRV